LWTEFSPDSSIKLKRSKILNPRHTNNCHASEVKVKRELDNLVVQMYASGITYEEAVREFRRRYIQEVLGHNKGNQCKAARELGVHRNTLSRIMADLELDRAQIKLGLKRPARSEHSVLPPVQLVRSK
jgi:Fis family transcriptional regulator